MSQMKSIWTYKRMEHDKVLDEYMPAGEGVLPYNES